MFSKFPKNNCIKVKPWMDMECKLSRKRVSSALRCCKIDNFSPSSRIVYAQEKNRHWKILKLKKRHFALDRLNTLNNCTSSSQFWRIMNAFRPRVNHLSNIKLDTWFDYLKESYPDLSDVSYVDNFAAVRSVPELDECITVEETYSCLLKCKNGKAPGLDGINYDFLKNLPQNWVLFINNFFNKILTTERVPNEWGKLSTFMLFKKEDSLIPDNYRPITLVNCIAKVFTQIICDRLSGWANKLNIIPESQAGIRRRRSCLDNVFCLSSVVQVHLSTPGSVVYAAFIDFFVQY